MKMGNRKKLSISLDNRFFVKDGTPVFLLADTVWTALNNVNENEWTEYLAFRKRQGFNGIQISPTSIPAASGDASTHWMPFEQKKDGSLHYNKLNEQFFDRAKKMLEIASGMDMIPLLIVLWQHHVPGTRWNRRNKQRENALIPYEAITPYVEKLCNAVYDFNPLFLITGDTDVEDDQCIRYYSKALEVVRKCCPHALNTLHVTGGYTYWPKEFIDHDGLHFYMYQSGHHSGDRKKDGWRLAQQFYNYERKRPIMNGEPCYEGHGYFDGEETISRFEVRKTIWQSVISGASAGVTYGAHGLWSWHRPGDPFLRVNQVGEPMSWKDALRLPGAEDASFLRWILEEFGLVGAEPVTGLVESPVGNQDEIRVARSKNTDRYAVYVPFNFQFTIVSDFSDYKWTAIDLEDRSIGVPEFKIKSGKLYFPPCRRNNDRLLIATRK